MIKKIVFIIMFILCMTLAGTGLAADAPDIEELESKGILPDNFFVRGPFVYTSCLCYKCATLFN